MAIATMCEMTTNAHTRAGTVRQSSLALVENTVRKVAQSDTTTHGSYTASPV